MIFRSLNIKGDVMLPHIFEQGLTCGSLQMSVQLLERVVATKSYVCSKIWLLAIPPESVRSDCWRISMTSLDPVFALPICTIVISLITMCRVWLRKKLTALPASPRSKRCSKIFPETQWRIQVSSSSAEDSYFE